MSTKIDISSNALVLIGDSPISSFTDTGAGAQAAAALYPESYRNLLSSHPWSFALKEQLLNQLSQTPDDLTNYKYAYQTPTDLIRIWAIFPHSNYVIVGEFIYSNQNELLARYVYQPDETILPPHFVKAFEYKLASEFAIAITENTTRAEYYEKKFLFAAAQARTIDSQGRPQESIIDSPFVDVRRSGRGFI